MPEQTTDYLIQRLRAVPSKEDGAVFEKIWTFESAFKTKAERDAHLKKLRHQHWLWKLRPCERVVTIEDHHP